MKKKLRLAACAAACAMVCSTAPVMQASALGWWGAEGGEKFDNMTFVDDKGMLAWVLGYMAGDKTRPYYTAVQHFEGEKEVYNYKTGKTETKYVENDSLYVMQPRENYLRFRVRDDLNAEDVRPQIAAVLDKYYPPETCFRADVHNGEDSYQYYDRENDASIFFVYGEPNLYDIQDKKTAGSAQVSNGLLHDLAETGLISAFYTWGQTARYNYVDYRYPTLYNDAEYSDIAEKWDAVSAWVAEHHPECEVISFTAEEPETAKRFWIYESDLGFQGRWYAVAPPEGTPFTEHFELGAELYEQFGIKGQYLASASTNTGWIGQNALEQTGDLNMDGRVTISDAVLLARLVGGDSELQLLQYGINNADINADGLFTVEDLDDILDMVVGK